MHIYPPAAEQLLALTIGRPAHFYIAVTTLLLGGIQRSNNVPVDFFEFFSTEFAACSKPPSRDNPRKASYLRTQQRDQGAG